MCYSMPNRNSFLGVLMLMDSQTGTDRPGTSQVESMPNCYFLRKELTEGEDISIY
jgi:hypothetical protein